MNFHKHEFVIPYEMHALDQAWKARLSRTSQPTISFDGLSTFRYRSRYEFAGYHNKSPPKPSPYLVAKLHKHEALQRRCGPGTGEHSDGSRQARARIGYSTGVAIHHPSLLQQLSNIRTLIQLD